ncbi:MAG: ABC transporter ATP-binding protein [Actinobacteria bacterium]|nr:ABC transporter ATP-binding protein [Actinomycetota bacterium]
MLHGVTLDVGEGEFVALFGPNGHGKSTLLKTVCGLLRPSRGTVHFYGENITALPVQRIVDMGLVYIPEERHLFLDMTVMDNLKMGAFAKRARKKERENLALVFDVFPRLQERRNQSARTLSGGEAQMLAMGRGLMADARFLAIDEPSLGLAPNLVSQIFATMKEVNQRGIGILLVEQSVAQACDLAERAYLLEEGRMVLSGPAGDILHDARLRETVLGAHEAIIPLGRAGS